MPSQYTCPVSPAVIAIPVPDDVLTVTVCAVPFFTINILVSVGTITVAAPDKEVPVSVKFNIAALASAVVPLAVDNVAELLLQVFIVLKPAMASSTILVMLSFTTLPQLPLNSP